MPQLPTQVLADLRVRLATFHAAIYLPEVRIDFACPNNAVGLHHCDREFTLPQAEHVAQLLAEEGTEAHVLVYGVPWTARAARKPAQGA